VGAWVRGCVGAWVVPHLLTPQPLPTSFDMTAWLVQNTFIA
jgi:hypothetical protein